MSEENTIRVMDAAQVLLLNSMRNLGKGAQDTVNAINKVPPSIDKMSAGFKDFLAKFQAGATADGFKTLNNVVNLLHHSFVRLISMMNDINGMKFNKEFAAVIDNAATGDKAGKAYYDSLQLAVKNINPSDEDTMGPEVFEMLEGQFRAWEQTVKEFNDNMKAMPSEMLQKALDAKTARDDLYKKAGLPPGTIPTGSTKIGGGSPPPAAAGGGGGGGGGRQKAAQEMQKVADAFMKPIKDIPEKFANAFGEAIFAPVTAVLQPFLDLLGAVTEMWAPLADYITLALTPAFQEVGKIASEMATELFSDKEMLADLTEIGRGLAEVIRWLYDALRAIVVMVRMMDRMFNPNRGNETAESNVPSEASTGGISHPGPGVINVSVQGSVIAERQLSNLLRRRVIG